MMDPAKNDAERNEDDSCFGRHLTTVISIIFGIVWQWISLCNVRCGVAIFTSISVDYHALFFNCVMTR